MILNGKLEQELIEISDMARQIKKGSLILLNEILATTSEEEGSEIMAEVIRAFSKTNSHIVFVTHMSRLANLVEEDRIILAERERAINYVTEQSYDSNGNVKKTYRIKQGKPEKSIIEKELVNHYLDIGQEKEKQI